MKWLPMFTKITTSKQQPKRENMQIKSSQLVITRHTALVEYLKEIKLVHPNVEVIEHATPEMVKDRVVFGVLPHSLSCLTTSFTEVPLVLPAELRGVELSIEDIRKYAKSPVTYIVQAVNTGES